jgi:hypothetical protein
MDPLLIEYILALTLLACIDTNTALIREFLSIIAGNTVVML